MPTLIKASLSVACVFASRRATRSPTSCRRVERSLLSAIRRSSQTAPTPGQKFVEQRKHHRAFRGPSSPLGGYDRRSMGWTCPMREPVDRRKVCFTENILTEEPGDVADVLRSWRQSGWSKRWKRAPQACRAHQRGVHRVGSTRWAMPGIVTTARRWCAAPGPGRGRRGARPRCSGSAGSGAGATDVGEAALPCVLEPPPLLAQLLLLRRRRLVLPGQWSLRRAAPRYGCCTHQPGRRSSSA